MRKLKEKIDVAISKRRQLNDDLVSRNEEIGELLKELTFLRRQAAKVEGLIDENVKQANRIEELVGEIEVISRQVDEGLL